MIYGERIRFRAPEREDIPLYVEWFNDPEVIDGLSLNLPMSTANEEQWFDDMLERPLAQQPLTIEAREGEEWRAIGNWGFFSIDWTSRTAELGIAIGEKNYWNQGYGTETLKLSLKVGFEIHNFNRICLRVMEHNARAVKAYEKAGFMHEGAMREAVHYKGKYIDMLFMSVLRSEWVKQV